MQSDNFLFHRLHDKYDKYNNNNFTFDQEKEYSTPVKANEIPFGLGFVYPDWFVYMEHFYYSVCASNSNVLWNIGLHVNPASVAQQIFSSYFSEFSDVSASDIY